MSVLNAYSDFCGLRSTNTPLISVFEEYVCRCPDTLSGIVVEYTTPFRINVSNRDLRTQTIDKGSNATFVAAILIVITQRYNAALKEFMLKINKSSYDTDEFTFYFHHPAVAARPLQL